MENLNSLSIFVKVAEHHSFSVAAERLGITPSGASRAIGRLEQKLGVKLLNRTTRSVSLTDDGMGFFQRCRQILADIEEAKAAVTRTQSTPRGHMRVQIPVGFGKRVIVPALAEFAERYPELVLDVELNDRGTNLAREKIDIAVKVGDVRDSRLIAKRLCHTRFIACAAPAYLEKYGEPRSPDELKKHHCLGYFIPQTGRYREWEFAVNGKEFSRTLHGTLNINNGEALLDAAMAGAGIANIATFVAAEAIASGKLKVVLRDFIAHGPEISMVYLPNRRLSPNVRAFADFLSRLIPSNPPWDRVVAPDFRPSAAALRRLRLPSPFSAGGSHDEDQKEEVSS